MEIEQITTEWWVDQGKKIPRKKSKYPETKLKWKPTKPVWHSQKKKKKDDLVIQLKNMEK